MMSCSLMEEKGTGHHISWILNHGRLPVVLRDVMYQLSRLETRISEYHTQNMIRFLIYQGEIKRS